MKSKPTILTISHQKKGHGTFPRHERMAIALKKKGFDVIWISPKGYRNINFRNINLAVNFIPDCLFISIYIKLFFTCLINKSLIKKADYVLAIREYDAIALFLNPFLNNVKKIFFSRGDVISILNINLQDRNFLQKLKDKFTIFIYPTIQKIIYIKSDLCIFQANFLRNLFLSRIKKNKKKTIILPNECRSIKFSSKKRNLKKKVILGFAAPMYWSCKGLDIIVNLYNQLIKRKIDFKLLIAGKGPHANKFKNELSKISKENFYWIGWVNNIYSFFGNIDLLVVSSKYDSCPNLLLEGLNANKILFASNISAHKEIIKSNELIFNINKINLLVSKIENIKKSNKEQNKIQKIINKTKNNNIFDWDAKFSQIIKKC